MTENWIVDAARTGDGAAVAHLLGMAVPPEVLPLTIWGSPRAGVYVEDVIQDVLPSNTVRFFVLRRGGWLGGAIGMHFLEGQVFFDGVYVEPELRKASFGNRIIAEATEHYLRVYPSTWVSWDVFDGQPSLDAFYEWLGGQEQSRRSWWTAQAAYFGRSASSVPIRFEGLAKADQQHERWGFSSFTMHTPAGAFRVGRLHAPYFRLMDPVPLEDHACLEALARLDVGRSYLRIDEAEDLSNGWRRAARSHRLRSDADLFLRRLRVFIRTKRNESHAS